MADSNSFPVVGMGASAGGVEAFRLFFSSMPADCGMAFIIILHLPPDRKSMLSEVLSRWTAMPVIDALPGPQYTLQPNHVYVPAPHTILVLEGEVLQVKEAADKNARVNRPIDEFFDALGYALRERAIGIVLSGTGSDGALGLKALKNCGGLTIAQGSNGTAPQYGEMPDGAIATGAVDLIVPVDDMPKQLLRLKGLSTGGAHNEERARTLEQRRLEICSLLRKSLNHDFSDYRSQTFLRRVERRMHVVGVETIDDYIAELRRSDAEVKLLFLDLLIRVTSFFRDVDTFKTLAAHAIPQLFEGKAADGMVRVWIPGCATGEEAYSLAMLLREHVDSLTSPPKVQIFATDIDEAAVKIARIGRYPKALLEGLSEERRGRFFVFSQGTYLVRQEIRELCTFSHHDLIRDPPFSMMSLVSCRNLLIYMNPTLQGRVIPVFHYSLLPGGILLLGGSESVSQHIDLFDIVDKKNRIFRRRAGLSPELNLRLLRPMLPPGSVYPQHASKREYLANVAWGHRASGASPDVAPFARFKELLAVTANDPDTVSRLKEALSTVCEELQSLAEEHQTALEELRSSNEELHSVNEEIQSTNEELETSKEELQSLNEELHTVNIRLTEKVEELDHTNSDLRNLFESTQIATIFLDRHLIIRSFTPAIANLYNLIPSDQGRSLSDIVHQLRYSDMREDIAHVLSTLKPLERRVIRIDGSVHYIMRILPYREPDSSVSGALVTFVDVTSIVRAEEALIAADTRKDEFLAILSHELRNPLAPIRNASQLLQSPKLEPEVLARLQIIIARQVAHMSRLLDDLLDISRITRGAFPLKKAYAEVRSILGEAIEAVQAGLDAKEHTLRVDVPASPIVVEVDPVRITQAITNLLTNAAKYTPAKGLIDVEVRLDSQFLRITVRDNGIGLSTAATDKIFDMFTRVDSDISRVEGGLGIGLALARGLIKLHGGKLEVSSAGLGKGSEFVICLPISLVVQTPAVTTDSVGTKLPSRSRRILVADDNRDAAESLTLLLQLEGHETHIAYSGEQAFDIAKAERPDVGVFDIGMPDLNGYELAERIRHEAWGKSVLLIAVTGWGQETDRRKAFLAGFDHHLTKPIDPQQLEDLLESVKPS